MTETIPLLDRTRHHADRAAIISGDGDCTYQELLEKSHQVASYLLSSAPDLAEARVTFMVRPGMNHVATQWGIWRAGGIAVPLCVMHPAPELAHVIDDCGASIVVADAEFESLLRPLAKQRGLRFVPSEEFQNGQAASLPKVQPSRPAMILYTSGTTGKPKGVVSTHDIISAQIRSLVEAWGWEPTDHILHVLPLHHLHGIVNVLCCSLWVGATCQFLPKFDPKAVWQRISEGRDLTLFMAVPTIYARLIAEWESVDYRQQEQMSAGCNRLRLMVCGSAALPVPILEKWRQISGHTLLERYGMTEIGMGLSNPLHGERRAGYVGKPLPGVKLRLIDEQGQEPADGKPGQIQIKGSVLFDSYWRRPESTREAFTDDGWFKTGDVAVCEDSDYRILGRESVDIIKTGGFKVSALEIENRLCSHEAIRECAVVGVADLEWGERVGVAVVLQPNRELDLESLREWGKQQLAVYKVPSLLHVLDALPRNPMGKVTKPQVIKLFEADRSSSAR